LPTNKGILDYAKTDQWRFLEPKVIAAIEKKFESRPEYLLELFVQISEYYELVDRNFRPLVEKIDNDTSYIVSLFAVTLQRLGTSIMTKLEKESSYSKEFLQAPLSCYTIAITMDKFLLTGYMSLAAYYQIVGDLENARLYCQVTRKAYRKMLHQEKESLNYQQIAMLDTFEIKYVDELEKHLGS
jgi:hypothetical protein